MGQCSRLCGNVSLERYLPVACNGAAIDDLVSPAIYKKDSGSTHTPSQFLVLIVMADGEQLKWVSGDMLVSSP